MQRLSTSVVTSARGFATAASHTLPKKVHGTSGRYAGATFLAASKVELKATFKIILDICVGQHSIQG